MVMVHDSMLVESTCYLSSPESPGTTLPILTHMKSQSKFSNHGLPERANTGPRRQFRLRARGHESARLVGFVGRSDEQSSIRVFSVSFQRPGLVNGYVGGERDKS